MKHEIPAIVTRMAPSPTGHLHVGTVRTALYNYLFAKRHGGTFILRSEDTDPERSRPEYEAEILEGLTWLGITWEAFYRQSERTAIYRGYLERAIENGTAYLSKEESKREAGTMIEVVRLKNPNEVITFEDEIRGEISFDTTELGDFVIARTLDDALYHFTVVVDDHEMGVTHVIRGEDHISNTPRQILIQEAIGAARPTYAHLPLLLGKDRSKLSKRNGTVQLSTYREEGFIKEAIVNYLAFLGWNPGTERELFSLPELIEHFDLSGIQKGGAIFDIEKLKWFNKEHLKAITDEAYLRLVHDRLPTTLRHMPQWSEERLSRLLPVIRERIAVMSEITVAATEGEYDFAFQSPTVTVDLLGGKAGTPPMEVLPRLQRLAEIVARLPEIDSAENIKQAIWDYAEQEGRAAVLWPLRVALSGRERSPDPFTIIHVIGSAEAYKRIQTACSVLLASR